MNRYSVCLNFEDKYEIEAEDEVEAIDAAMEQALRLGEWEHDVELIEENITDE